MDNHASTAGSPKYAFAAWSAVRGTVFRKEDVHGAAAENNVMKLRATLQAAGPRVGRLLMRITDAAGRTALHWAAERGSRSAVQLLLQHGADAHLADGLGRTPLMLAVKEGHLLVVNALLEHAESSAARCRLVNGRGADCTGLSALGLAQKYSHDDIASVLIKHGAEAGPDARRASSAALAASRWLGCHRRAQARARVFVSARAPPALARQKSGGVPPALARQKSGGVRKQKPVGRTRSVERALLERAVSAAAQDLASVACLRA